MGRTIVVGDVHGCASELERLLRELALTPSDRLVFVGDLVARGPDTLGVLAIVRRTNAEVVRGNHEQKLLTWRARAASGDAEISLGRWHRQVADALTEADWALLEATPLSLDLPEHDARVVHAGVLPGLPFEDQEAETLLHVRAITVQPATQEPTRAVTLPWGRLYAGPPHMVFGHAAIDGLQLHPWATGLDTGCVYGGRLSALVLAANEPVPRDPEARGAKIHSVPAERIHFEPRTRQPGRRELT